LLPGGTGRLFLGARRRSTARSAALMPAARLGELPDLVCPFKSIVHFHMPPCKAWSTLYCFPRYSIQHLDRSVVIPLNKEAAPARGQAGAEVYREKCRKGGPTPRRCRPASRRYPLNYVLETLRLCSCFPRAGNCFIENSKIRTLASPSAPTRPGGELLRSEILHATPPSRLGLPSLPARAGQGLFRRTLSQPADPLIFCVQFLIASP
jgi:hypothetical protein